MTETLFAQLAWFVYGLLLGAAGALTIAWHRGAFNPVVKLEVNVVGVEGAPITAGARIDRQTIQVKPQVLVSWDVVYKAADGAGMALVPKELAPPRH